MGNSIFGFHLGTIVQELGHGKSRKRARRSFGEDSGGEKSGSILQRTPAGTAAYPHRMWSGSDIPAILQLAQASVAAAVEELNCSINDEYKNEEDDPFSAVLREMKLKGEFPCRLCHAVFPNLRALKGSSPFLSSVGFGNPHPLTPGLLNPIPSPRLASLGSISFIFLSFGGVRQPTALTPSRVAEPDPMGSTRLDQLHFPSSSFLSFDGVRQPTPFTSGCRTRSHFLNSPRSAPLRR